MFIHRKIISQSDIVYIYIFLCSVYTFLVMILDTLALKILSWLYSYLWSKAKLHNYNNVLLIYLCRYIFMANTCLLILIVSRFGRRLVILVSIVFGFGSTLGLAWVDSFVVYCILRFIVGVSTTGTYVTGFVLGKAKWTYKMALSFVLSCVKYMYMTCTHDLAITTISMTGFFFGGG